MIILLILISIIGFIIAYVIDEDFAGFFLVCFCVLLVIGMFLGISVSNGKTIDEKIVMYQEENNKIEKQIDTLVSNYMNYESDTYEKIESESSITLVSMYPERIEVIDAEPCKEEVLKSAMECVLKVIKEHE